MPSRPAKPCAWVACNILVRSGSYCSEHQPLADAQRATVRKKVHRAYNKVRDETDARYKTEKWRRLSIYYRKLHPLCKQCELEGRVTESQLVDHIKPTKTHPELFFEWSNLRALCKPCHNSIGERVGLTSGA